MRKLGTFSANHLVTLVPTRNKTVIRVD